MEEWLVRAAVPVLSVLLAVIVLGLGARNLSPITLANRQPLTQFGELELRSLPAGGGIVISDIPEMLTVFQAAQAESGKKQDWLPVATRSLVSPEYRARLERLGTGHWPVSTNAQEFRRREMLQLTDWLAQRNQVYYLHPGFGAFNGWYYQHPTGLVFEIKRFSTNATFLPTLAAEAVTKNEPFWDDLTPQIESLQRAGTTAEPSFIRTVKKRLYLGPVVPSQVALLKEWYSMALNSWGVELQRNGRLPAAQRRFNQALLLDTNNWVARINLNCNSNLQAGTSMSLTGAAGAVDQLGSPEKLVAIMSRLGTIDDPVGCFLLGNVWRQAGLPRWAMQQYERARVLAPDSPAPEFALADLYLHWGREDLAMASINHLRESVKKAPENSGLDVRLSVLEAGVWLSQSNLNRATGVLHSAVQQHPNDIPTLIRIAQAYFAFGDFTNAEQLVIRVFGREPDNVSALLLNGHACKQNAPKPPSRF